MEQLGSVTGWEPLLKSATVALTGGTGGRTGTGFFVAPGLVVTCAHVLADQGEALPEEIVGQVVSEGAAIRLRTRPEWYFRDDATGLDVAFLADAEQHERRPVLLSPELEVGDRLWAYGHPDGLFRAGQPATFVYEGSSRRSPGSRLELPRLRGTPVTGGFSGGPVVNLRTGAICGMLSTSDHRGSAHMIDVADIMARGGLNALPRPDWLAELTDEQLRHGGWSYPGRAVRAYLRAAEQAAKTHPYPGVLPDVAAPPLAAIYVQQNAGALSAEYDDDIPLSADFLLGQDTDALVVGGPGAGKSCLLRMFVTTLAERQRNDAAVTEVPVLVQAADLAGSASLPQAIAAGVHGDLAQAGLLDELPADFFRNAPVPGGRWLVLVDGLDEILDLGERRRVIGRTFGVRDIPQDAPYRFIVATRPLAWAERPQGAASYALMPLSEYQLALLAERWFSELELPLPVQAASRLVDAIKEARLSELARTPLMATILCQLFAANPRRELPRSRVEAYEAFLALLRERSFSATSGGLFPQTRTTISRYGPQAVSAAEQVPPRIVEALCAAAFDMFEREGRAIKPDVVYAPFDKTRPGHVPEPVWQSLVREIARRSGLVLQRAGGEFVFVHQTIAEFLAARHIREVPDLHAWAVKKLKNLLTNLAVSKAPIRLADQFVLSELRDVRALRSVLTELAKDGNGSRLIARLAREGVVLPENVRKVAADRLVRNADRFGTALFETGLLLDSLDDPRASDLLLRQAEAEERRQGIAWRALDHLLRLGDQRAHPLLARIVNDPCRSRAEQGRAAIALARTSDHAELRHDWYTRVAAELPRNFPADWLRSVLEGTATSASVQLCLDLLEQVNLDVSRKPLLMRGLCASNPHGVQDFLHAVACDRRVDPGQQLGQITQTYPRDMPKAFALRLAVSPSVSPRIRVWAVGCLRTLPRMRERAITVLKEVVGDPAVPAGVRSSAAVRLMYWRASGPEILEGLARDRSTGWAVRHGIAHILISFGEKRGLSLLAELAADPACHVIDRCSAALALLTREAQALVTSNPQGSAAQPDVGDEVARLLADVFTDESLDRTARRIALGGCARRPHPSIPAALSAVVAHPALDPGTRRLAFAHLSHRDPEAAVGAWLVLPPTLSGNPALLRVLLEVADPLHAECLDRLLTAPGLLPEHVLILARQIVHTDPQRASDLLASLLNPQIPPSPRIRAAYALACLDDPRGPAFLSATVGATDESLPLRAAATEYLTRLTNPVGN
ncbi:trypsin-like peptidase domain-containing protein [Nonomuraea sp. NPDC005692]|uniref:trypsin-like peptidase domain-containing protein n=1 Tax=Nonomuraea sp. NPDC005692 TaxID=3157168 RepID=UPI0033ED6FAC